MGKKKKMSFEEAKREAKKKLGIIDIASLKEPKEKLVLFHGKRGGHSATYSKTTKEFWFV